MRRYRNYMTESQRDKAVRDSNIIALYRKEAPTAASKMELYAHLAELFGLNAGTIRLIIRQNNGK